MRVAQAVDPSMELRVAQEERDQECFFVFFLLDSPPLPKPPSASLEDLSKNFQPSPCIADEPM